MLLLCYLPIVSCSGLNGWTKPIDQMTYSSFLFLLHLILVLTNNLNCIKKIIMSERLSFQWNLKRHLKWTRTPLLSILSLLRWVCCRGFSSRRLYFFLVHLPIKDYRHSLNYALIIVKTKPRLLIDKV